MPGDKHVPLILDYTGINVNEGLGIKNADVILNVEYYTRELEKVDTTIDLNANVGWLNDGFNIWASEGGKGGFHEGANDSFPGGIEVRITAPERAGNPRKSILQIFSIKDKCVKSWIDLDVILRPTPENILEKVRFCPFLNTLENSLSLHYLEGTKLRGLLQTHEGKFTPHDIDLHLYYKYNNQDNRFEVIKDLDRKPADLMGPFKALEIFNYREKGIYLVGYKADNDDTKENRVEISLSVNLKNAGGYFIFDDKDQTHPLSPHGSWTKFSRDKAVLSTLMGFFQLSVGEIETGKDQLIEGGAATVVFAGAIFFGAIGGVAGSVAFAIVSTPLAAWAKKKLADETIDDKYFLLENYSELEWQDIVFDTAQNTIDALIGAKVGDFYKGWTEAYVKQTRDYTAHFLIENGDIVIDYVRSVMTSDQVQKLKPKFKEFTGSLTNAYNTSDTGIEEALKATKPTLTAASHMSNKPAAMEDIIIRKLHWFQPGDTRQSVMKKGSYINFAFAIHGQHRDLFNCVWQSKPFPRIETLTWKPQYAVNWVEASPSQSSIIVPERAWVPLRLGGSMELNEDGIFVPSPREGKEGVLNISDNKLRTLRGIHIILGIWSNDTDATNRTDCYKPFFVDEAKLQIGGSAEYKPLQTAYWWLDKCHREGTFLDLDEWDPKKDPVIVRMDFSKNNPAINNEWYTTWNDNYDEKWVVQNTIPEESVLDRSISNASYPIKSPIQDAPRF